jgi:hypothetical protein
VIRREPLLRFSGFLFASAAAVALAGCPTSTAATAYTPVTGILIRSSSLVAGRGCGTGPGQVYRYAAELWYADEAGAPTGDPQYSGVFDCFTDGLFSNLPPQPGTTNYDFTLKIYAYDFADFPAALACPAAADPCTPDVQTFEGELGTPTWTTTCSAAQQSGVSVLAVCAPLTATGSGSTGDAGDAGPAGDAGDATAQGDAGDAGEAGQAAEAGGAGDAGDGGAEGGD